MPNNPAQRKTATKRRKGCRRDLPRSVKRTAKKLSKFHATAFLDYCYTARNAALEPFPVTPEKISRCLDSVADTAPLAARARAISWRNATNAVSADDRLHLGLDAPLPPPLPKRKMNAPAGTFPTLEDDLARVTDKALQPHGIQGNSRKQANAKYCKGMARRVLVTATTLLQHDVINKGISLRDLVSPAIQAEFLRVIELAEDAGVRTSLRANLTAIRFFVAQMTDNARQNHCRTSG